MDTQTRTATRTEKPRTRSRGRDLLTDAKIKAARATQTAYKLTDGAGLHLLVTPAGAKLWRLRFLHPTKRDESGRRIESMLSLGPYPEVSLSKARTEALKQRTMLEDGIDPAEKRRVESRGTTFRDVALEWLELQKKAIEQKTYERHLDVFERLIFPDIGGLPVASVDSTKITKVLKAIDGAGKHETARRSHQRITGVLKLARALKLVPSNEAEAIDRKTVLTRRGKPKHHASIKDPVGIGQLLRDIDGYQGQGVTVYALKLAPYVMVRPGELRHMEWAELDLISTEPQWLIPAEKMKMKRPHIVPLAPQAVAILRAVYALTGPSPSRPKAKYVFPAVTTASRPMSENTENTAIRRLGYDNTQMTAHGFRSMASTRLNAGLERSAKAGDKYRPNKDWIEMQLSHTEEDESRESYNEADWIDERREMMAEWANYLDRLRKAKPKAAK